MQELVRENLEQFLGELRPRLHRYCARMTGSAVDGEDIVQDAMTKAFAAPPPVGGATANPEGWLFKIAHNTALDFLRRRARRAELQDEEILDTIPAPEPSADHSDVAAASLRTFMRLPPLQRSAVILKDVLGHSLEEIASITGATEPAVKSALQRGRVRLREFAAEPEDVMLPMLSDAVRARLNAYVDGFKAGDFDAVRSMLAEDVLLDLVARRRRQGKGEVGEYYGRYAIAQQWAFAAGVVDGRPAMLVYDRAISLKTPAYFVSLEFRHDRVVAIRDFLFARYAMEGIAVYPLNPPPRR
jgi:RNA polymerase sigma-70 factor (ECF subfamily)